MHHGHLEGLGELLVTQWRQVIGQQRVLQQAVLLGKPTPMCCYCIQLSATPRSGRTVCVRE
ncbi:MAG TPA: hypothetical protein VEG33_20435, partial [Streptosporangiaceae bacterium]|nr:hypothetical protein [Streptosporangiaceae bacterium]